MECGVMKKDKIRNEHGGSVTLAPVREDQREKAQVVRTCEEEREWWPSGLGRRPATGRSMVRVPLR